MRVPYPPQPLWGWFICGFCAKSIRSCSPFLWDYQFNRGTKARRTGTFPSGRSVSVRILTTPWPRGTNRRGWVIPRVVIVFKLLEETSATVGVKDASGVASNTKPHENWNARADLLRISYRRRVGDLKFGAAKRQEQTSKQVLRSNKNKMEIKTGTQYQRETAKKQVL